MAGSKVMSRKHLSQTWQRSFDSDDVWHDESDLFTDIIQEVMDKWNDIDDQIWAKVIVMERNCRVGKAFLRRPEVVVTNEEFGFDINGRIGLRGFSNKMRDSETEVILKKIGKCCKISMDPGGNIWIKNLSRTVNCHTREALSTNTATPVATLRKLFDVNRFKSDIKKMTKANNLQSLTQKTISIVQFGEPGDEILDQPLWFLVINIVALDFLKSKLGVDVRRISGNEILPLVQDRKEDEDEALGHPLSWHSYHVT